MRVQAEKVTGRDGRLDSWKAIADYLGRDVRSVQRWESERGLPVRRIPGTKGGVFAYVAEIDAWLNGHPVAPDAMPQADSSTAASVQPAEVQPPPVFSNASSSSRVNIRYVLAATLLLVFALAAGGYLLVKKHSNRAPADLTGTRPMLAVLPFANLSGDPSQDYFADGLTEELITEIGRLDPAHLGVIARTSSMQYKQTNKDVARIGRELNVDYLLEGSVRREQGAARISAQLIRVQDQSHVWAQSYQRNVEHVLDVQREVAAAVADKIRFRILASATTQPSDGPGTLPEAYDNYLEGLYFANQRSLPGLSEAVNFFTRAIAIDPNYAAAYAGLAQCYSLLVLYGVDNPEELKRKAKAAAAKAVALDDSSSQAHVILAGTKVLFDFDWAGAESHFQRALLLNPNNALAHHWYANLYLAPQARFPEAIAEMKLAQQLDPLSLIINTDLGFVYYLAGDDDAALTQLRKVLDMDPKFVPAHFDLSLLYYKRHRYDRFVDETALDFQASGRGGLAAMLQETYAKSGYPGVARLIVASQDRTAGGDMPPSPLSLASAHLFLGNTQQALSALESAYASRDPGIIYLKVEPAWSALRPDPRFQALERRAGLLD